MTSSYKTLRQYFPMIRTREEVISLIQGKPSLLAQFSSWPGTKQELFLNYVTAVSGLKPMYDSYFKEIFNPEYAPERLEDLISCLLGQKVTIRGVLANDSTRIADEKTLLITDIIVELADGSIANVEIQRRGYDFPGQRSACYSADLLLRQYRRIRSIKHDSFTYRDVRTVYCIVLFEKSPDEFKSYPDVYVHRSGQRSDTGIELDLLQKYVFIPLDIFANLYHNNGIRSKLDAWLVFLCQDSPEAVLDLLAHYKEFRSLYEQLYQMCRNVEDVMGFFSEELRMLDQNTVQYMIDRQAKELEELRQQKKEIEQEILEIKQQADDAQQQAEVAQQQADDAKLQAEAAVADAAHLQYIILQAISDGHMPLSAGMDALHMESLEELTALLKEEGLDLPGPR